MNLTVKQIQDNNNFINEFLQSYEETEYKWNSEYSFWWDALMTAISTIETKKFNLPDIFQTDSIKNQGVEQCNVEIKAFVLEKYKRKIFYKIIFLKETEKIYEVTSDKGFSNKHEAIYYAVIEFIKLIKQSNNQ